MTVVPAMPEVSERVRALHARMTLAEKLAQLVGFWVDQGGEVVAPMQGEMASSGRLEEATAHGIGHLTRVNGTRPVDPAERAAWLWREQRRLRTQTRLGIPALVSQHESPELIRTLSLTGRDPLSTAGRVPHRASCTSTPNVRRHLESEVPAGAGVRCCAAGYCTSMMNVPLAFVPW